MSYTAPRRRTSLPHEPMKLRSYWTKLPAVSRKGRSFDGMRSEEDSFHIALESLWDHDARKLPFSEDELNHLYACEYCVGCLGICHISDSIEQAKRLQRGKLKRS